jgi:aryl-alcohol dehydrogenase-like predicted oxidoreductase
MEYRELGGTGIRVSAVSFGSWAIGGAWGDVDDDEGMAALHAAIDQGVNFIDTADNYGMGRSEKLIGDLLRQRKEEIHVATKCGKRFPAQVPEHFVYEHLRPFAEQSRENLGVESLDVLQVHCPPAAVYWQPQTYEALERLKQEGVIRHYGFSVAAVDEAIQAMTYPGVEVIQVIFNAFRQKPLERVLPQAREQRVGIICRIPLASGLLTGKFKPDTVFAATDHRLFNRHGERFDVGETFAGVPYEVGLAAVEELRPLVPEGWTMARFALRWILMEDAVSCAIAGARKPSQVTDNTAAAALPPLSPEQMRAVREVYDRHLRPHVHHLW